MRYKLFNGRATEWHLGDPVPKLNYTGQIVMAIDPSKTNCAVVIGDPGGEIISILEMSGNNWSAGPVDNTTVYCSEVKNFLSQFIERAELYKAGLEQAITKRGMQHHHSNMVLTEIRGALLDMFYEKYRLTNTDVEVNNWSWKHAILPDGYRSQNEKGSRRYFYQYLHDDTYINYYEADVTDCLCIYKYLIRDCKDNYRIACRKVEEVINKHTYAIMPEWADKLEFRKFEYNPSFTVEQNATYFANRSKRSGIAKVDIGMLSMDDIYANASGFDTIPSSGSVRLVVAI